MDGYLAHHGIKGQRWGVRNGPPYPLAGIFSKKARERRQRERTLRDLTEAEYMPGVYFVRSVIKDAAKDEFTKFKEAYGKVAKDVSVNIFDFESIKKVLLENYTPKGAKEVEEEDDDDE